MSKIVIYATNLGVVPKNLADVVSIAKSKKKLRITEVSDDSYLAGVNPGDNLVTDKGNQIYVVDVHDGALAELPATARESINNLYRNYGLKESNISKVSARVKYETWCKDAAEFSINKSKSTKPSVKSMNSIKNFGERIKSAYMPEEVKDVRIATDGNICVATSEGYVAIDNNYKLTAYPEEFTLAMPMFTMAKPIKQVAPGDVIARERSYVKVKAVKEGRITAVGYTGRGAEVYPIKDFFLGQTTVRVVVSPVGNLGGSINPLMLMALSKDKKNDSLLPLLLMGQNGSALGANPMALALLAGDGDFDIKEMLLYSSLAGGQNPFANLFGAPTAPGITVAPAAAPEAPKAE